MCATLGRSLKGAGLADQPQPTRRRIWFPCQVAQQEVANASEISLPPDLRQRDVDACRRAGDWRWRRLRREHDHQHGHRQQRGLRRRRPGRHLGGRRARARRPQGRLGAIVRGGSGFADRGGRSRERSRHGSRRRPARRQGLEGLRSARGPHQRRRHDQPGNRVHGYPSQRRRVPGPVPQRDARGDLSADRHRDALRRHLRHPQLSGRGCSGLGAGNFTIKMLDNDGVAHDTPFLFIAM